MRLTGKNVNKIDKNKRIKIEQTLTDMTANRIEDSIQLRKEITEKIRFLETEKEKAENIEKELREQLSILQIKRIRFDGAIIALTEVLESKK